MTEMFLFIYRKHLISHSLDDNILFNHNQNHISFSITPPSILLLGRASGLGDAYRQVICTDAVEGHMELDLTCVEQVWYQDGFNSLNTAAPRDANSFTPALQRKSPGTVIYLFD
jgi:hypothetical protein